jgi:hypothetical protein
MQSSTMGPSSALGQTHDVKNRPLASPILKPDLIPDFIWSSLLFECRWIGPTENLQSLPENKLF